jgi:hypothetical protein
VRLPFGGHVVAKFSWRVIFLIHLPQPGFSISAERVVN